MASKRSNEVTLPCCCGSKVKVTNRKRKLWERPREHACKGCGAKYYIGPDLKPVAR